MIASVENGKIEFRAGEHKKVFAHTDIRGMARFFDENQITSFMCSSSCDFPEEYGLKDVDVRDIFNRAIEAAYTKSYKKRPKGWKPNTLYMLGDSLPYDHPFRKLQGTLLKNVGYTMLPNNGKCVKAIWTEEYREPKKGEWYLSGAKVVAYRAPNDLSTKYFIAKPVLVERKTYTRETVICQEEG